MTIKTWTFIMEYIDEREITIEAETEEDARRKMDEGDFADETTIGFRAHDLVRGLMEEK